MVSWYLWVVPDTYIGGTSTKGSGTGTEAGGTGTISCFICYIITKIQENSLGRKQFKTL